MKWVCKLCDILIIDFNKDKKFRVSNWRWCTNGNHGRICNECYKNFDIQNYAQKGRKVE